MYPSRAATCLARAPHPRAEERLGEHVDPLGVLRRELDRPVQLDDDPTTVRRRQEVDADESGPGHVCRRHGQCTRLAWRIADRTADSAKTDVGTPLAGGGDPVNGPDHTSCGHDDPKVVAMGRHELLYEPRGAGTSSPR